MTRRPFPKRPFPPSSVNALRDIIEKTQLQIKNNSLSASVIEKSAIVNNRGKIFKVWILALMGNIYIYFKRL
jgi:hypothetical protein